MNPFEYQRADQVETVLESVSRSPGARFLAGGTNLVDLMKNGVEQPTHLIDINRVASLAAIQQLPHGALRIGALARNSDTANHSLVRQHYPLLAQALLAGASPQLRNAATIGGNLLQRTRCYYFMDPAFSQCNKRTADSGCAAREGLNRIHAILGASDQCIATNPSDMSVALAALEAQIRMRSATGERTIPIADFHRLPGSTPELDTNLKPGELILSVDLPKNNYAAHSHYLKVRDRASYAFALVSVAAALDLDGKKIKSARIALGGVAHKPWRSEDAELVLAGREMSIDLFQAASEKVVAGARPYAHNAFKVELAKQTVIRALSIAGGLA